jgi:hypothetical protein
MQPPAGTARERGVGPFVTCIERVRPDGVIARWGFAASAQAPAGRPDLVGSPGARMVDRRAVRHRLLPERTDGS